MLKELLIRPNFFHSFTCLSTIDFLSNPPNQYYFNWKNSKIEFKLSE